MKEHKCGKCGKKLPEVFEDGEYYWARNTTIKDDKPFPVLYRNGEWMSMGLAYGIPERIRGFEIISKINLED